MNIETGSTAAAYGTRQEGAARIGMRQRLSLV